MKSTIVVVRELDFGSDTIGVSYSVVSCFSELLENLRQALNSQSGGAYLANPCDVSLGICMDGVPFVLVCSYDAESGVYIFKVLNPATSDVNLFSVDDYKKMSHLFLSCARICSDIMAKKVPSSSFVRGLNLVNRCFFKQDYTPLSYVHKNFSATVPFDSFIRTAAGFED